MNLYAAIRWLSASECPLSGAYGASGERFVLIEASSAHGTGACVHTPHPTINPSTTN